MAKITFLQGTPKQYASLAAKDSNTLYFISETGASTASLYLGAKYVAGITNLNDLYDVAISTLADSDILLYNTALQAWENISLADVTAKIAVELGYATVKTAVNDLTMALSGKADAGNVYTKLETDVAISAAIINASHLKRLIVDSLDEIDTNASDALSYIYMLSTGTLYGDNKYDEYLVIECQDGSRALERVGSWEVQLDDYVKISDLTAALSTKADKGTSLLDYGIVDAYTKSDIDVALSNITTTLNAEIKRSSDKDSALDADIASLSTKLNTVESGAQANKIETANSAEFVVLNKQLELKAVPAEKITGLDAHDVLKQLNASIGANAANITNNASALAALTIELNAFVKKTKYDQDIASLTETVTWHELH